MISVCMATYNGERYLLPQLESILSQLGEEDELIVSDDGSTDATLSLLAGLGDSRIRLFYNERHGFVHNFENALCQARGEYIFLSDQDDLWLPQKVSTCLKLLQNCLLVTHNARLIDGEGKDMGQDFFSLHRSKGGFWHNLLRNSHVGCCMAFRRELLQHALPFPQQLITHDIWLGLVAEKVGKTCMYPLPLICYRRHHGNVSSTSEKSRLSVWRMLQYRWHMFRHCLMR